MSTDWNNKEQRLKIGQTIATPIPSSQRTKGGGKAGGEDFGRLAERVGSQLKAEP
jgi:hypothetical protein